MKTHALLLAAFGLVQWLPAQASPALDERYALRKAAAVVIDADREAVYAEGLQTQLSQLVRSNSRFEWSDEGFLAASEWLRQNPRVPMENWQPLYEAVARAGTQSLVVAQLGFNDEGYALSLRLVTTTGGEVMARAQVPVGARPTIGNLNEAARNGWQELLRAIPFDASILRREGYRVILDRGRPAFREGMRLSAFTLEHEDNVPSAPLTLVETGLIQITRVENNLSFGRVVVEWKPREVESLNKIRSVSSPQSAEKGPLFPQLELPMLGETHAPSSLAAAAAANAVDGTPAGAIVSPPTPIVAQQARLGTVSLDLTGNSLAVNRTVASSGTLFSQSSFFPGATLRAEMYLTKTWFAGMSYGFGIGGWNELGGGRVNGSYNQFRLQAGYRWNMLGSELGPSLRGRFGYSMTSFGIDASTDVTVPTAAGYKGLLVGGDFIFPFTQRFGIGLEGNALLAPSLSEDNGTSGSETKSVSAWDFALRAYYQLDPVFRLDARFVFQTFGAEFTGAGTAPASLTSMSTGGRAFLAGLSYGF